MVSQPESGMETSRSVRPWEIQQHFMQVSDAKAKSGYSQPASPQKAESAFDNLLRKISVPGGEFLRWKYMDDGDLVCIQF